MANVVAVAFRSMASDHDGYAAEYMGGGGGEILLRDKTVWRLGLVAVGLPALASWGAAAAIAFGADPSASPAFALIPAFTGVVLTACAALFTVLRVVVSTKELHVQYGLFGPRIPIESIESCENIAYRWTDYGGWGVRMGRDGSWAYSVMVKGKRAVRIRWKDGNETKITVVSSEQPDAIIDAVARARASIGSGVAEVADVARTKVRVEDPTDALREQDVAEPLEVDGGAKQSTLSRKP